MRKLLLEKAFSVTTYHYEGKDRKEALIKQAKLAELLQETDCKTIEEFIERYKKEFPNITEFKMKIIG